MKFTDLCGMATSQQFCKFQGFPTRITSFQGILGGEVKFQEFPGVGSKLQEFSKTPGIPGVCRNPVLCILLLIPKRSIIPSKKEVHQGECL